nr:MAG TPA: hypothetical protein [Caudoviricetes sp.]
MRGQRLAMLSRGHLASILPFLFRTFPGELTQCYPR